MLGSIHTGPCRPCLATAVALGLTLVAAGSAHAVFTDNFTTTGDWDVNSNWDDGAVPWDSTGAGGNTGGDPVIDFNLVGASMTVDTAVTYIGSAFGADEGQPVEFRRIGVGAFQSLTITDGGLLDFSGGAASDTRITLVNTDSGLVMTGGTLQSNRSSLSGINLAGATANITVSGNSVINVFDPTASVSGLTFNNTNVNSEAFHVIGSDPSIDFEAIRFTTATTVGKFKFTFDAGGVSSIDVTDQIDFTTGSSVTLDLVDGGLVGTPNILLFDLANGSTGEFTSVTTDAGTFSGADGTQFTINGALYELDYGFGDGNDIGLTLVPEPASTLLLLLGAHMILPTRARRHV